MVVFTAETFDGDGFRLLDGLRFAHSAPYVETAAGAAGLRVVFLRHAWARREADVEAPGLVVALAADFGATGTGGPRQVDRSARARMIAALSSPPKTNSSATQ